MVMADACCQDYSLEYLFFVLLFCLVWISLPTPSNCSLLNRCKKREIPAGKVYKVEATGEEITENSSGGEKEEDKDKYKDNDKDKNEDVPG